MSSGEPTDPPEVTVSLPGAVTDAATSKGILDVVPAMATGAIAGTVTREDTGAPVADVWVSVMGPEGGAALTGADGSYLIEDVAPGEFSVQFAPAPASGLVSEYWEGAPSPSVAARVAVTAGTIATGIDASLIVGGSISGQVRYDGADYAWGRVVVSGARGYFATGFHAEPNGRYAVTGIAPGVYTVEVLRYGDTDLPVASQLYDRASTVADAQTVTVDSGSDITGIDFDLVGGVRIEGNVTAENPIASPWGAGYEPIDVVAYRWDGSSWSEVARMPAWGDYAFSGPDLGGPSRMLAAGTYTVGFEYAGHRTEYWKGTLSLDAADSFVLASGETRHGIDAVLAADR